jgi:hypothetical protein
MNRVIAAAALIAAIAAPAMAQSQPADSSAAAIVADCNVRKFETSVEFEQEGKKRLTKLKLCAVKDADDAAWLRTLEDARAKIAAHPEISSDSKTKIAAELDAEIAKLKIVETASLPAAPAAPPIPLPEPAAPPPPAPVVAATASPVPVAAKPRLTIKCLEPGEPGSGRRCLSLESTTLLTIRADTDLPPATSLRFVRRGDVRGEVPLTMRQGQSIRSRLPPQLCAGVSSSKVEIQVMGANQVVETLGPYLLRCL